MPTRYAGRDLRIPTRRASEGAGQCPLDAPPEGCAYQPDAPARVQANAHSMRQRACYEAHPPQATPDFCFSCRERARYCV